MYTHVMVILINRCLLNVVFGMTETLNFQSSEKKEILFFQTFNVIWKVLLLLMFVFLFFTLPLFQTY